MQQKGLAAPQLLPLTVPRLALPIAHADAILLVGSCFTEHMSTRLAAHKFRTLQNPHGILFNPLSVAHSLKSYAAEKLYSTEDLFFLNDIWNSWDHHSRFSNIDKDTALADINASQKTASAFLREAKWIVITLGSAFQYQLKENSRPVANNHRAPGGWFERTLLSIPRITEVMEETIAAIKAINPAVNFLFTISPVRHVRDGVVDNNRSKARLIEAVHDLCSRLPEAHYFPAYEIVIDVLRDYRYYDLDMVHPNYSATSIVWEEFVKACIDSVAWPVMDQVREILTARSHRARFPETKGHRSFLAGYAEKASALMQHYPHLDLREELVYFRRNL